MDNKQAIITDHFTTTITDWYCDDIRLTHTLTNYTRPDQLTASNLTDVVRLHFGLKGDYRFTYRQLDRSFDLIGGHHNIMYSNGFDIVVDNKTPEIETFGIQFPKALFIGFTKDGNDYMKRFCEDVMNGKSVLLSENWGPIDVSIQQVISQILHCRYNDHLKKLFLLSKSIELLVLSVEAYNYAADKKDIFIKNKTDKEKIIAVRDLINGRLDNPPGLSEIVQLVGLNEYKLKRGFKETFQTTVFEYLTGQRLQLATHYLQDTRKTSAEIAYELGYSTPQHFNNAYKKKFGITPNSVRINP
ncbi:AraC family transcriptional regulator [Chitinophaga niastensis]|uniref:AraC family transcriptional regulator n=1 Tax=Chitinophaga niastensis TaxID=536980 RepID=A0A2P8HNY3_CHINA|nr:AraC family transcriptional regulator [Chitinophaga niastensis]PSL47930.1 AraC family transcriptional regulator [Chitinophaga niastensis]